MALAATRILPTSILAIYRKMYLPKSDPSLKSSTATHLEIGGGENDGNGQDKGRYGGMRRGGRFQDNSSAQTFPYLVLQLKDVACCMFDRVLF